MIQQFFSTKKRGASGEKVAESFLKKRGFAVVGRNYRCRGGEIDLIVKKGEELHFVEVRSRSSKGLIAPEESVTYPKRARLLRTAQNYLARFPQWKKCETLFSVVGVTWADGKPEVEFFPNAFEVEDPYSY